MCVLDVCIKSKLTTQKHHQNVRFSVKSEYFGKMIFLDSRILHYVLLPLMKMFQIYVWIAYVHIYILSLSATALADFRHFFPHLSCHEKKVLIVAVTYCIQPWIHLVLFSPYSWDWFAQSRIHPSPFFLHIPLCIIKWAQFKICPHARGRKGWK